MQYIVRNEWDQTPPPWRLDLVLKFFLLSCCFQGRERIFKLKDISVLCVAKGFLNIQQQCKWSFWYSVLSHFIQNIVFRLHYSTLFKLICKGYLKDKTTVCPSVRVPESISVFPSVSLFVSAFLYGHFPSQILFAPALHAVSFIPVVAVSWQSTMQNQ